MDGPAIYSERTSCTKCNERIEIIRLNIFAIFACPVCGILLKVSALYRISSLLMTVATSLLLASLFGVRAYAAIAWFPLLILCFAFVPHLAKLSFPPRLRAAQTVQRREPWKRSLKLLLVFWFGQTLFLVVYGLVLGWASYLLGGSRRDIREVCEFFSAPLIWANSSFQISPSTTLTALLGILFANSFFYAVIFTLVTRIVQSRIRRPVTQLGISSHIVEEDDEEDV